MEAIEALLTRRTVPPVKMCEPGPGEVEIGKILQVARAAPDHGRLTPWRFILVKGDARVRLGELFAQSLATEDPSLGEAELDKHRTGPLRAPVIIIVACKVQRDHPKIPVVEQLSSAAAAAQNVLLAAHAMGFAAKWATGKPAYSEGVKRGLGLAEGDRILAIHYIGSYAVDQSVPERVEERDVVVRWEQPLRS